MIRKNSYQPEKLIESSCSSGHQEEEHGLFLSFSDTDMSIEIVYLVRGFTTGYLNSDQYQDVILGLEETPTSSKIEQAANRLASHKQSTINASDQQNEEAIFQSFVDVSLGRVMTSAEILVQLYKEAYDAFMKYSEERKQNKELQLAFFQKTVGFSSAVFKKHKKDLFSIVKGKHKVKDTFEQHSKKWLASKKVR